MYVKGFVVLVLGSAFWPMGASAECTWEWLCDASGEGCSRGAVCDPVDDVMPPAPPDNRPVVASCAEPPRAVGAPPAGTSDCKQVRRCDSEGNCIWDTLCLYL